METLGARLTLHDLELPALILLQAPVGQLLASVGSVGPNLLEARHEGGESAQELADADGIMEIGGGNVAGDGQSQGIDQQMPFPTFHLLVRVISADAGGFLDGLHALAIQDGRARLGMATHALPLCPMQRCVEPMPPTVKAEPPEMVEHRLRRREVAGEVAPGAAGAQHVEDGIKDAAQRMGAWSAACR